jgi:hypothetical protein
LHCPSCLLWCIYPDLNSYQTQAFLISTLGLALLSISLASPLHTSQFGNGIWSGQRKGPDSNSCLTSLGTRA